MTTPDEVQTRGPFVAEYSGVGRLTFTDGHCSEDGPFWAGQAHNGDVFICCVEDLHALADLNSPPANFSGQTASGLHLDTCGPLTTTDQSIGSPIWITVLASQIELTTPEHQDITNIRYGLTNFLFCETDVQDNQPVLPLELIYLGKPMAGHICQVPQYASVSRALHAAGGSRVTAELVIDSNLSEITTSDCDRIAEVLCRVLSIARGTQIAWIYRISRDSTGNPVSYVHSNHVTRNYYGLSLLSDRLDDAELTKMFAETMFPAYLARSSQYMFDIGSLDTYLEAKSGEQYLEMRALKATVAMEMLVAGYFSESVALPSGQLLDPAMFNGMVEKLRDSIHCIVLEATGDKEKANRMTERGRVRGLNQPSLSERVHRMWTAIGLQTSPADADLIEHSRNCLAHTGRFACSPQNRAAWHGADMPWSTPVGEYGFLLSLLDRTILRILNYDGPYIDWRRLDHYERHMHVND